MIMNAPSQKFIDKAMAAIDALRVFAHNVQLDETTFKSATFSAGSSYREVIEFRSTQCWGEVSRTKTTVAIKVIPHVGKADDFRARTLLFSANHYADSFLFTSSTEEFLSNGGQSFCLQIAEIFEKHSPNRFSAIPYYNDGDRLIMIGERTPEDFEHSQDIDLMAGGLRAILVENEQTAKAGMAVYIQHPAFDLPGTANIIDRANRVQPTSSGIFAERLQAVVDGTKHLLPALMFDNIGDDYPVSFEVTPLRFTIGVPQDLSRAKTQGMMAAQRIAVRAKLRSKQ
jgi:hypothetical protein